MKSLRRFLDQLHPSFGESGKLKTLYPLYEAADTFLYTPDEVAKGPTHVRDGMDVKRLMGMVVVALGPCILMAMYNTGLQTNRALEAQVQAGVIDAPAIHDWRGGLVNLLGVGYDSGSLLSCFLIGATYFLPVYLMTQLAGGFWEVLFAVVRKHEINEGFLVTGVLYPLTLPPGIPLWQVALGISFGVVIAKEVFGGTGKNFLNPALAARAFLYFAFPAYISGEKVWVACDGFSAATSLGAQATSQLPGIEAITAPQGLGISWGQAFLGTIPGSMGETSTLCCLFGAAVLIATGVGSWRIMAAVVLGALGTSTLFYLFREHSTNPMYQVAPHWHLVIGGLAFGLVFMATDPVSAAMTQTGKWFYGGLIGVLTILIRLINPAYAEGIMLAILFGNVCAPLIDYFVIQANIKRRMARSVV